MFESDGWDLDQDILSDVDNEAIKYYSQKECDLHEPKRRKTEDENLSLHCDLNTWVEKTSTKITQMPDEKQELRKNLIFGLLKKNLPNILEGKTDNEKKSNDSVKSSTINKQVQNFKNDQVPRKNIILAILKNKSVQANIIENNAKSNYMHKNDIEINSRECSYETPKKHAQTNTLEHQCTNDIDVRNDNSKYMLPIYKPIQVQPTRKMTLVRKFPGPAGLLPDDINASVCNVQYLNSLEENEKTNKESDSNSLTAYCSQTTKNLFSEGAWQLMLDHLPNGFLKGHSIANIKRIANLNGCNGMKVKYLAGIIEHIDFNHENPPITLKDFTDNVHGIVHRDIPLKYPGLLETNVVVLLHDVGLLKTSGTFASNKYQILISPTSLLAIYTGKGVIEEIKPMETVFKANSRGGITEKIKSNTVRVSPLNQNIETDKARMLPNKRLPETSESTSNIHGCIENDSDDEMLSQLDMDTILTNYNSSS